ncbi:fungal-specific transcription factor domain-containing protein [Mycena epipterygia]|nr:fungal-specific transcription factor domain-containing protein [Mycena epipterygia]
MSSAPVKRDVHNSPDGLSKKRRKGATRLSCAECRRLKLRCDRSIPCGSCIKRGCGAICPDGSLTTGQGNRFVLASTQELHEKISELANRVRELEDALRSSHSHLSNEQHPLLSEELLRIKAPLQREVPAFRNQPAGGPTIKEEEHNPDVVDAFGSLSISLSGGAKYFGTTANSWYFLQNETAEEEPEDDHLTSLQSVLPAHILTRAAAFPISPVTPPAHEGESLRSLFWYLPPGAKAAALRDIYFTHAAWMYAPISPESFEAEVYSQFYDPNAAPPGDQPVLAHRLSLMFIVLAIGSLMDTAEPAYNLEAEKYHQLARAALFLHSFFDQPTINAVQSLFLMAYYLFLADRHGTGSGARWAIMGIAVKVAQSVHRDSGRWKVDPIETQRRRELFWELFTYDSWQCLTFGRPTSFALAHVDCKMPHSSDPADDQAFYAWKHRFCSECMIMFHDQAFGAKTPTYATVLQLDRKMRAFPVPPILQVAGFGSSEPRPGGFPETIMLTLQRHIVLAIREMNLLYLHRSFFARAISDHPKDPLGSPYGTSVIAAYRSAGSLVALMRNLHSQLKEPSERIWFLWTHMFSCAIILGSIVTRCPSMSLAPSALVQLDSACELFSKAARGFRAVKVLNIMLHLQEKAHHSLEDFRKGKLSPSARRISPDSLSPQEENDELSTLGGKTRLVAKKEPVSPLMLDRSPTSHNPVVPLPLSPSLNEQVHPSVLEYLNTFQQPSSAHGSYSDVDVDLSPSMFHQNQARSHSGSSQRSHAMGNGAAPNVSFPQYFPVYDYRTTTMNDGYGSSSTAPILDVAPMPGQRRASGSPEGNMNSSIWQDFVGDLVSMN